MRKPSGISAADTQAIAAVLEKAELLGDHVPKQVWASDQTERHWCCTAESRSPWLLQLCRLQHRVSLPSSGSSAEPHACQCTRQCVQVEELKALVSSDSQEPINARHRRTLRRCAAMANTAHPSCMHSACCLPRCSWYVHIQMWRHCPLCRATQRAAKALVMSQPGGVDVTGGHEGRTEGSGNSDGSGSDGVDNGGLSQTSQ